METKFLPVRCRYILNMSDGVEVWFSFFFLFSGLKTKGAASVATASEVVSICDR